MQMKDTVLQRIQNPEEFKSYKNHYSYEHLADDMNARGCRTVRGKSITASNIRKLVSDCNKLDDSEDFYRDAVTYVPTTSQPIYYMYYDPLVYKLDSVFIPTWYAYITPYVELNTSGLYIHA